MHTLYCGKFSDFLANKVKYKMNCPYCNHDETKVNDSRESKDGATIKRRRECLNCEKRFSTVEKLQKLDLEVEKSNGSVEEFNINKIKNSLLKACEKRPITLEQIEEVISAVIIDLKRVEKSLISTSIVGQSVLIHLKELDEIAFLKYAIVHNNYTSMSDFMKEIGKLKDFKGLDYKNQKQIDTTITQQ
jgi:transcriptional repressor NrdR